MFSLYAPYLKILLLRAYSESSSPYFGKVKSVQKFEESIIYRLNFPRSELFIRHFCVKLIIAYHVVCHRDKVRGIKTPTQLRRFVARASYLETFNLSMQQ
jgi:hypothetical protein